MEGIMWDVKRLIAAVFIISVFSFGIGLPISAATAADGPAGPGWIVAQGTLVSPEDADAYYQSISMFKALSDTPASATTATPEITALARALKNDPRLIYEYVRNNVDYDPYFGSLKGATLTYLDGSGNDFDQASLMIALLRASNITAQYVYGTMMIPAYGDANQKDMQHWLGVDANNTVISNVLSNGGIPGSQSGANWIVDRVWVQATISGTNYLFDPAFKPHQTTSGINLHNTMGYDKSALLSAVGGTVGTDYVQNLNEASLKSTLDGYTLNLANYIRANYPNAQTSEIIGGKTIVPQTLATLPASLDFPNVPQYYWTDIPDTYVHKVRIKHGGIDQTLNIPDLAGQKLSLVYRAGAVFTASSLAEPVTTTPLPNLAIPVVTAVEQPISVVPTGSLDTTLPNVSVPSTLIDGAKTTGKTVMDTISSANFGSIYPASAGASSNSITWGPMTNSNSVTVQIVVTLTSNPNGAYSITAGAGTNNVGPGSSISVTVKFSNEGQTVGTKIGQLKIQWQQTNGAIIGTPSYFNLTGYVAKAMSLDGYGLNVQTFMNTPSTGFARLSNNGDLPLSVTAKTITGADAARFQFVNYYDSTMISIQPGTHQDIQIRYLADVHGTHTASINMGFTYDGMIYNATNYLPLQGRTFYSPDLTGSYGFNFGTAYLGSPVDGVVRLVNAGTQPLYIYGIALAGADAAHFTITGGDLTSSISPGQYRDISVRYLANSEGTHAASVHGTYSYDGRASIDYVIDLALAGQTVSAPVAQLWLDDQLIAEETEPVSGTDLDKMTISVTHPYSTTFADQSVDYTLKRGSTYAIVYDFGGSRLGRVLEKRERQMQAYRESGLADTSRQVLTESLNVIGMTWMRDTTLNANLLGQIAGAIDLRQHRFGVVAQESGYYIDVKVQLSTIASVHGDTVAEDAYFHTISHLASAMEHGVLEQMQNNSPSVSTVKLLQLNNANGSKVFMANSANFAAIMTQLSNYSTQDLADLQASVNSGNTLILPENGKITLQSWSGKGYIDFRIDASSLHHVGMIIGGGYNGGYAGNMGNVNVSSLDPILKLNISPDATKPKIGSSEPVDMATGFWMYENTDLTLSGGMGGLSLKRSYNSGNNNIKDSLGYGWSHNYRIYVEPHSSSPFGLGLRQPLDGAALIAASVATLDIMSNTPDLKSWMVGALIGKWGMDNLTNNAACIHLQTDVLSFVKLPDGTFASPPGTTSKLVKSGNLYRIDDRFSRTVNFGSDNNVSSITDADGNAVSFTYSNGLLQSVSNSFGQSLTFNYTEAFLTSVDDSAGRSVSYGYDDSNNLTSYTDPEGKVWSYGPDGNHRIQTLQTPLNITTVTNVYDSFGRVQSQTMPRQTGSTTFNLYFSGYRNIEEDSAGHQTIYYFDDQKHLLGVENALGQKNIKNYDGQGHVVSETDARSSTTGYLYDGNNNLTTVTDPFGKQTINSYDSLFRLTDVTDPLGHLVHTDFDTKHHPYKTTVYPETGKSIYTQKSYYPNGLVNTTTDGKGVVTTLTQDAHGNPATSKTSTAPVITYVYDAIGRMTSLTDQEGAKTILGYDKRSLFTGSTDPLDKNVVLEYYDDGSLWKLTDRNNKTTTFTYTPSGKPNTVAYQGGATVSYTYDQNDFLTGMQDSIGATSYVPDVLNRLASSTDPRHFAISYAYDTNGNISQITYPGNKTVSYFYDALNRVKTVTIDWLAKTATYNYDDAGRMDDLTQFNNTYTKYTHDNANRLTGLENRLSEGGSAIAAYSYTLDDNGNRTDITQTVPIPINVTPATRAFTMNPQKNRLQQAGTTAFTYDNEGQLATKTGEIYTFDDTHRVVNISGANYSYRYDGAGNRLEATRNGVVTRYIYDANGNLLAEADGSNVIQKYYIYGNGLLAMVTPGNQVYCYHFDGTGHTVALTDASANVVNKYAYTPFGKIAGQQETVSQPFKYVGKYGVMTEPNGLYYMKARYYDSAVGRFISEDPKGFDGGDVNLTAYVQGNPVNAIDPSGMWTLSFMVNANAAFAGGGGGGTALNVGYSKKDGFSISLTGTAQGGAIAGGGTFIGSAISYTNANNVNQLNGTSYQAGRAGLGPLAVEGVRGADYGGGTLYGGIGTGYTANSVTASTTSAILQYNNGVISIGNTGSTSLWTSCGH